MHGYVLFANNGAFQSAHAQARVALGLPHSPRRRGRIDPHGTITTDIAIHRTNQVDSGDRRVISHVKSEMWPADLVSDFVFLTRNDVADFFPEPNPDV